jgi:hypothetical protein
MDPVLACIGMAARYAAWGPVSTPGVIIVTIFHPLSTR